MLTVVGVIAAVWLLLVVLAAVFQRQLIYLPMGGEVTPPAGVDVEPLTFTTHDGLEHEAWLIPAAGDRADGDPVSVVVVASGNAGNRAVRVPMAEGLAERGHAVLLLDYRGYGGNPGSPTEDDLIADARIAVETLLERDDVPSERVAFFGESLGTGVVAAVALEHPPAAMVLRSPFPELADVGRSAYPFLPVGTLLRDRYPVTDHLEAYEGPILVVAAGRDRIVPTPLSRQVAEPVDADLVVIDGVGHNDPAMFTGARFLDEVDAFLRVHVGA